MLDAEHYKTIAVIRQNSRLNIIIQRYTGDGQPHYCIQYAGNGHYFDDGLLLQQYYLIKFGRTLILDRKRAIVWDKSEMKQL